MGRILDYASPATMASRRFWPAAVVALVGCPATSMATGVLGCQLALNSVWLSSFNLRDSILFGTFAGVLGGLVVLGLARAFKSQAVRISIIGSLIVNGGNGAAVFVLASAAAC